MNTLEQLNNYSSTSITYTDNRPFGVVFDKSIYSNLDSTVTLTNKTFDIVPPINIEEIIDATSAQVEYEIELPTNQATVTWSSLPAGVSLVTVGNRYILRYLSSVTDWETIKDPTVTVDNNFFGDFFYKIKIRYQTPTGQQTVSGQVGAFIPASLMSSVATMSVAVTHVKGLQASLLGVVGIDIDLAVESYGLLAGPFSLTAGLTYLLGNLASSLPITATTNVVPTRIFNGGSYALTNPATMSVIGDLIPAFDESVTSTETYASRNTNPLAADAGRLIYGTDTTVSLFWAEEIRERDGFDGNPGTLSTTNTNSDRIDISSNKLILTDSGDIKIFSGSDLGTAYNSSTISGPIETITSYTGSDVAASLDYVMASEPSYNSNAGRIHVYSIDGSTVTTEYTITVSNSTNLGSRIAANEDYIIALDDSAPNADSYLRVFDPSDGSLVRSIQIPIFKIYDVSIADDYAIVSSGLSGSTGCYIYNLSTGATHRTITTSEFINNVSISKFFYAVSNVTQQEVRIYLRSDNSLWKTIDIGTFGSNRFVDYVAVDAEFVLVNDYNFTPPKPTIYY